MRIIAGQYRRRIIHALDGLVTRPMPDRVRESLFAMLGTRVQKASVLDLFAGSGAIGLEALSRGAASCLFVERDREAAALIEHNISLLGCADRARVVIGDALGMSIVARAPRPLDLAFFDPPYPMVKQQIGWDRVRQQATALGEALATDGFLVLRTPWPFEIEIEPAVAAGTGEGQSGEADANAEPGAAGVGKAPGAGAGVGGRRASKKRKYQRDRVRWDELDDTTRQKRLTRDGSMRRGSEGPESPLAGLAGRGAGAGRGMGPSAKGPGNAKGAGGERVPPEPVVSFEAEEEELDDAVVVRGSAVPPVPPALVRPGDLTIAGLRGPETHAYGTTAVHWYMKG